MSGRIKILANAIIILSLIWTPTQYLRSNQALKSGGNSQEWQHTFSSLEYRGYNVPEFTAAATCKSKDSQVDYHYLNTYLCTQNDCAQAVDPHSEANFDDMMESCLDSTEGSILIGTQLTCDSNFDMQTADSAHECFLRYENDTSLCPSKTWTWKDAYDLHGCGCCHGALSGKFDLDYSLYTSVSKIPTCHDYQMFDAKPTWLYIFLVFIFLFSCCIILAAIHDCVLYSNRAPRKLLLTLYFLLSITLILFMAFVYILLFYFTSHYSDTSKKTLPWMDTDFLTWPLQQASSDCACKCMYAYPDQSVIFLGILLGAITLYKVWDIFENVKFSLTRFDQFLTIRHRVPVNFARALNPEDPSYMDSSWEETVELNTLKVSRRNTSAGDDLVSVKMKSSGFWILIVFYTLTWIFIMSWVFVSLIVISNWWYYAYVEGTHKKSGPWMWLREYYFYDFAIRYHIGQALLPGCYFFYCVFDQCVKQDFRCVWCFAPMRSVSMEAVIESSPLLTIMRKDRKMQVLTSFFSNDAALQDFYMIYATWSIFLSAITILILLPMPFDQECLDDENGACFKGLKVLIVIYFISMLPCGIGILSCFCMQCGECFACCRLNIFRRDRFTTASNFTPYGLANAINTENEENNDG